MRINLIKTNIRLFLKHRLLLVLTIIFPIVFNIFFGIIFTTYDVNQIPVGIIDEDQSKISSEIMTGFNNHPSLIIKTRDLVTAEKLLRNNQIEAYFIIKDGFEEAIQSSDYEKSIDLYYLDKSSIGPALGDLIAAEIMMPLAIHKAANMSNFFAKQYDLESLHDQTLEIANYHKSENTFKMAINTRLKIPKLLANETLDIQKVLRLNMTSGFSLIVMSFVILFSNGYLINNYFKNIQNRLITAGMTPTRQYLANYVSVLITTLMVLSIELIILCVLLKVHTPLQVISIGVALLLYGIFLTTLVTFLTQTVKNLRIYQSILAPLLFIIGLLGGAFWSLEFLSEPLKNFANVSPIAYPLKIINISLLNSQIYSFLDGYLGYIVFIIFFNIVTYTLHFIFKKHKRS